MNINLIKLSFRSLIKNRLFTLINVLGLAFGFTCSILISLWVWDEIRFDGFHQNQQNIYKILGKLKGEGNENIIRYAPSALAQPILQNFPQVNKLARVFSYDVVIEDKEVKYSEKGFYADPSFLDIFSFPLKEGSTHQLFQDQAALGKEVIVIQSGGKKSNYRVAGVLEKIPNHSSLQFDFVLNYESFEKEYRPWWRSSTTKWALSNFNVEIFAELNENIDFENFNNRLDTFLFEYSDKASDDALLAYPFSELYLRSDFSNSKEPTGRIRYVRLFSLIAIIILVVAAINFMNLSTAVAGKRAKEVGLRKSFGASRFKLIVHFTFEAIMIACISMLMALTLVDLILPHFNLMTGKS
ncbi:MAG: ABC transporter permease, partial [Bacteroidota bacterium]